MAAVNSQNDFKEIYEHTNSDFPFGIYFVNPDNFISHTIPWHWHDEYELDIVREGSAVYTIGDEEVILNVGDAILIKSNVFHSIAPIVDSFVIISLIFSPTLIFPDTNSTTSQSYLDPMKNDKSKSIVFLQSERKGRSVISLIDEIIDLNLNKSYGYELLTKSFVCQLWYLLVKDLPRAPIMQKSEPRENKISLDDQRIKDAISFISENYAEAITLEDIADSIHISKSECCRLFKRSINISPIEYLMHYRITQACDIMIKSQKNDESISFLATRVGFNSASYFNKIFREYIGCTPTEFRRKSKAERRDKLSTFGLSFSHL